MNVPYTKQFTLHAAVSRNEQEQTRQRVSTLRLKSCQRNGAIAFLRKVTGLLSSAIGALSSLFVKVEKHHAACKFYGHSLPSSWEGHLPTCSDCGALITSADQLRKAVAR